MCVCVLVSISSHLRCQVIATKTGSGGVHIYSKQGKFCFMKTNTGWSDGRKNFRIKDDHKRSLEVIKTCYSRFNRLCWDLLSHLICVTCKNNKRQTNCVTSERLMIKESINHQETLNRHEFVLMMLPQGFSDNSLYKNMWWNINRTLHVIYKDAARHTVPFKVDYTYTTTCKYSIFSNHVDFVLIPDSVSILVDKSWQVCA